MRKYRAAKALGEITVDAPTIVAVFAAYNVDCANMAIAVVIDLGDHEDPEMFTHSMN